ncbi:hypothetical protein BRD08_10310 [Halobacteriales archaeon SW_10_66_29]|nr:MAG: hypothetical protein BRD08_10310 [Halobacteriales archaeon SW_10_66_29]
MDPVLLLTAGLFLLGFAVLVPYLREQYEEQYDSEREYFRDNNPRVYNVITGAADQEQDAVDVPEDQCPACGAENDPEFSLCHNCNRPLPSRDDDC